MDVEALKEFRCRLVLAQSAARARKFDQWIVHASREGNLTLANSDVDWNGLERADLWDWYWYASPKQRKAMWTNSIAAIDARIAEQEISS